jgi:hypothetical protein
MGSGPVVTKYCWQGPTFTQSVELCARQQNWQARGIMKTLYYSPLMNRLSKPGCWHIVFSFIRSWAPLTVAMYIIRSKLHIYT